MMLLNLRINFYLLRTFCPHLGRVFFLCCFFFHYVYKKKKTYLSEVAVKSPEEGQRWNLAETLWKKKQHTKKNYQDEVKKSAINKNSQIKKPHLKMIPIKDSHNDINHNSITIHIQIQADSFVSDTNGFINFRLRSLVTRGERHDS